MKLEKHRFDWREIVLFLFIIILTSVISNFGYGIWWTGADMGANYGFPFPFYGYDGGLLQPGQPIPTYFYPLSLILNIMIWFVVSYFVIRIYDKVKKK